MRSTLKTRNYSPFKFVACFCFILLLLVFGLFLTRDRTGARVIGTVDFAPADATKELPNLTGEKAKQYLKERGLYSSLSEAMQAARYSINPARNAPLPKNTEAFAANNPRQGFTTYFADDGVHLVSKAKDDKWRVNMNLEAYGHGENIVKVNSGRMEVQKDKSRIEIRKSAVSSPQSKTQNPKPKITEWYENSRIGLEQGWTISESLPNVGSDENLRLVLKLGGDLKAKLAKDGRAVSFVKQDNEAVLRYDKLRSWDADGKELASRMELANNRLSIIVEETDAKYPLTIDPFFTQTKQLTASDAAPGDRFGSTVSISGDIAIVGAPFDEGVIGSAYIFYRNTGGADNWGEFKKLTSSDMGDFNFGKSVSISGDTAVVGSPFGPQTVYIFERNSGGADNWGETKKLTSLTPGGQFGSAVAISGDRVIIGEPEPGIANGGAYIFERNTGGADNWGQVKKMTASNGFFGSVFGRAVAINGDVAVIGAPASNYSSLPGSAYIFERNTGGADNWGEVKILNASDGVGTNLFGAAVSVSGDIVVVGAYGDPAGTTPGGSVYLYRQNQGGLNNWGEFKKLNSSDSAASDNFGVSVSIENNTLVVGAWLDDDGGTNSGSAYVFERNMGGIDNWGESQKIAGIVNQEQFGHSVAIAGNNVLIGASAAMLVVGGHTGWAYVYTNQNNNWQQTAKSLATDGTAGDEFGYSVSISGSTAIVGAPRNDDSGSNSGSAYIFERNTGGADNWGQVKKLLASDGAGDDDFGWSVGISGDTVIVGAFLDDDFGAESGSAYIFERNSGGANNWGQVKKLTASDAAMRDYFGSSVGISGDTAIISGRNNDDGGTDSGTAYIFERNNGGANNWGEVRKLTASDAAAGDQFGYSVAISGDTAVVGALLNDDGGPSNGSAYIFKRNTGGADNWGEVKKLTASDAFGGDRFGCSVAIFEDTTIIGAYFDNGASGSAYIFERNTGGADNWGEVKKLTASDGAVGDQFGYSAAISADTAVVGAPFDDDGGATSGSAYIFQRNQGGADNWGELTKMTASDAATGDQFGQSVEISDDLSIVGAIFADIFDDISSLSGPIGKNRFGQKSLLNKTNSPDLAGANQGAVYVFNALAAPTAASATVAGRVMASTGQGISRVAVTITGLDGSAVSTRTNMFGYFYFGNISVGQVYVISVLDKQHQFTPNSQAITVNDDVTGILFTGFER